MHLTGVSPCRFLIAGDVVCFFVSLGHCGVSSMGNCPSFLCPHLLLDAISISLPFEKEESSP